MMLKGIKDDDDALKLVFLEFHLAGDALTKFENISNSPNPPGTYNHFKLALLAAFPIVQDGAMATRGTAGAHAVLNCEWPDDVNDAIGPENRPQMGPDMKSQNVGGHKNKTMDHARFTTKNITTTATMVPHMGQGVALVMARAGHVAPAIVKYEKPPEIFLL
uniref:Uncharacterized protein n=1 Tax=Romanomermis culicivorax TaxID=13658 RepID=A0A915HFR5_ROMCU